MSPKKNKKGRSRKSGTVIKNNEESEVFVLPPQLLQKLGINLSAIQNSLELPSSPPSDKRRKSKRLETKKTFVSDTLDITSQKENKAGKPQNVTLSTETSMLETADLMKTSLFLSPTFIRPVTPANIADTEIEVSYLPRLSESILNKYLKTDTESPKDIDTETGIKEPENVYQAQNTILSGKNWKPEFSEVATSDLLVDDNISPESECKLNPSSVQKLNLYDADVINKNSAKLRNDSAGVLFEPNSIAETIKDINIDRSIFDPLISIVDTTHMKTKSVITTVKPSENTPVIHKNVLPEPDTSTNEKVKPIKTIDTQMPIFESVISKTDTTGIITMSVIKTATPLGKTQKQVKNDAIKTNENNLFALNNTNDDSAAELQENQQVDVISAETCVETSNVCDTSNVVLKKCIFEQSAQTVDVNVDPHIDNILRLVKPLDNDDNNMLDGCSQENVESIKTIDILTQISKSVVSKADTTEIDTMPVITADKSVKNTSASQNIYTNDVVKLLKQYENNALNSDSKNSIAELQEKQHVNVISAETCVETSIVYDPRNIVLGKFICEQSAQTCVENVDHLHIDTILKLVKPLDDDDNNMLDGSSQEIVEPIKTIDIQTQISESVVSKADTSEINTMPVIITAKTVENTYENQNIYMNDVMNMLKPYDTNFMASNSDSQNSAAELLQKQHANVFSAETCVETSIVCEGRNVVLGKLMCEQGAETVVGNVDLHIDNILKLLNPLDNNDNNMLAGCSQENVEPIKTIDNQTQISESVVSKAVTTEISTMPVITTAKSVVNTSDRHNICMNDAVKMLKPYENNVIVLNSVSKNYIDKLQEMQCFNVISKEKHEETLIACNAKNICEKSPQRVVRDIDLKSDKILRNAKHLNNYDIIDTFDECSKPGVDVSLEDHFDEAYLSDCSSSNLGLAEYSTELRPDNKLKINILSEEIIEPQRTTEITRNAKFPPRRDNLVPVSVNTVLSLKHKYSNTNIVNFECDEKHISGTSQTRELKYQINPSALGELASQTMDEGESLKYFTDNYNNNDFYRNIHVVKNAYHVPVIEIQTPSQTKLNSGLVQQVNSAKIENSLGCNIKCSEEIMLSNIQNVENNTDVTVKHLEVDNITTTMLINNDEILIEFLDESDTNNFGSCKSQENFILTNCIKTDTLIDICNLSESDVDCVSARKPNFLADELMAENSQHIIHSKNVSFGRPSPVINTLKKITDLNKKRLSSMTSHDNFICDQAEPIFEKKTEHDDDQMLENAASSVHKYIEGKCEKTILSNQDSIHKQLSESQQNKKQSDIYPLIHLNTDDEVKQRELYFEKYITSNINTNSPAYNEIDGSSEETGRDNMENIYSNQKATRESLREKHKHDYNTNYDIANSSELNIDSVSPSVKNQIDEENDETNNRTTINLPLINSNNIGKSLDDVIMSSPDAKAKLFIEKQLDKKESSTAKDKVAEIAFYLEKCAHILTKRQKIKMSASYSDGCRSPPNSNENGPILDFNSEGVEKPGGTIHHKEKDLEISKVKNIKVKTYNRSPKFPKPITLYCDKSVTDDIVNKITSTKNNMETPERTQEYCLCWDFGKMVPYVSNENLYQHIHFEGKSVGFTCVDLLTEHDYEEYIQNQMNKTDFNVTEGTTEEHVGSICWNAVKNNPKHIHETNIHSHNKGIFQKQCSNIEDLRGDGSSSPVVNSDDKNVTNLMYVNKINKVASKQENSISNSRHIANTKLVSNSVNVGKLEEANIEMKIQRTAATVDNKTKNNSLLKKGEQIVNTSEKRNATLNYKPASKTENEQSTPQVLEHNTDSDDIKKLGALIKNLMEEINASKDNSNIKHQNNAVTDEENSSADMPLRLHRVDKEITRKNCRTNVLQSDDVIEENTEFAKIKTEIIEIPKRSRRKISIQNEDRSINNTNDTNKYKIKTCSHTPNIRLEKDDEQESKGIIVEKPDACMKTIISKLTAGHVEDQQIDDSVITIITVAPDENDKTKMYNKECDLNTTEEKQAKINNGSKLRKSVTTSSEEIQYGDSVLTSTTGKMKHKRLSIANSPQNDAQSTEVDTMKDIKCKDSVTTSEKVNCPVNETSAKRVLKRKRSSGANSSQSNVVADGDTDDCKKIKCGVCRKGVGIMQWADHISKEHCYIAWKDSDRIDLKNEELLTNLTTKVTNGEPLKCTFCKTEIKTSKKFLCHVEKCLEKHKYSSNKNIKENGKAVIVNSTAEPGKSCLCGVCHQVVNKSSWFDHIEEKHNYLAWKDGETPVDLHQKEDVRRHLASLLDQYGYLNCTKCAGSWTKLNAFRNHVKTCGTESRDPSPSGLNTGSSLQEDNTITKHESKSEMRNKKRRKSKASSMDIEEGLAPNIIEREPKSQTLVPEENITKSKRTSKSDKEKGLRKSKASSMEIENMNHAPKPTEGESELQILVPEENITKFKRTYKSDKEKEHRKSKLPSTQVENVNDAPKPIEREPESQTLIPEENITKSKRTCKSDKEKERRKSKVSSMEIGNMNDAPKPIEREPESQTLVPEENITKSKRTSKSDEEMEQQKSEAPSTNVDATSIKIETEAESQKQFEDVEPIRRKRGRPSKQKEISRESPKLNQEPVAECKLDDKVSRKRKRSSNIINYADSDDEVLQSLKSDIKHATQTYKPAPKKRNKEEKTEKSKKDNIKVENVNQSHVECGVCQKQMEPLQWLSHIQCEHRYLAWQSHETPLDLEDADLVQEHLITISRKYKGLTCAKCGTIRKYPKSFLSHFDTCQGNCIIPSEGTSNVSLNDTTQYVADTSAGLEIYDVLASSTEVTCAICSGKVNAAQWDQHTLKHHYNLAWPASAKPIDLKNAYAVERYLKIYKSKMKIMVCHICGATRASCMGFYAHVLTCGKTEEEVNEFKGTCDICNQKYLCIYKQQHYAIHKVQEENKQRRRLAEEEALKPRDDPENNAPEEVPQNNNLSGRRKAAEKARTVIENFSSDFQCKHSCPDCEFATDDIDEMKSHKCKGTDPQLSDGEAEEISRQDGVESEEYVDSDASADVDKAELARIKRRKHKKQYSLRPQLKVPFPVRDTKKFIRSSADDFMTLNYTSDSLFDPWRTTELVPVADHCLPQYLPPIEESCKLRMDGDWTTYKKFEGRKDSKAYSFFIGGVPQCVAWAPPRRNTDDCGKCTNYLAISCHRGTDSPRLQYDKSYESANMLQIWDMGLFGDTIPKLVIGLAHDWGTIWAMDWCPSGTRDPLPDSIDGTPVRLGLLAVACSNGAAYILSVPNPASMLPVIDKLFYKVNPVVELRLNLERNSYQATSIAWSKQKDHAVVVVGYSNGSAAMYDLACDSPLSRSEENGVVIIYPYYDERLHATPLTGVALLAGTDPTVDTALVGTSSPTGVTLSARGSAVAGRVSIHNAVKDIFFIPHWPALMLSDDFITNSELDWLGPSRRLGTTRAGAGCESCGLLITCAPPLVRIVLTAHKVFKDAYKRNIMNIDMAPLSQNGQTTPKRGKQKSNNKFEMTVEPFTYEKAVEKYGVEVRFLNNKDSITQDLVELRPERYPLSDVASVAFCPTPQYHHRAAIALHSGIVLVITA